MLMQRKYLSSGILILKEGQFGKKKCRFDISIVLDQ